IEYPIQYSGGGFLMTIGDFNGDGAPDIICVTSAYTSDRTVTTLLGRGDGTFLPASSTLFVGAGSTDASTALAAADLNGDGILDLVIQNPGSVSVISPTMTVVLGNGDGTFGPPVQFSGSDGSPGGVPSGGATPTGVAVADFNGDGKPDIIGKYSLGNNQFIQF